MHIEKKIDIECPDCGFAYKLVLANEDIHHYMRNKSDHIHQCPNCKYEFKHDFKI